MCSSLLSIYLFISPTPRPLTGTSPKVVATAELSPGLPVQALSLSALHTSPTRSLSPTLFHSITGGLPLTPLPSIVLSAPGIYVEGIGGVRIENDIIIREGGCESLNTANPNFDVAIKG